jgi:hypothetical protein
VRRQWPSLALRLLARLPLPDPPTVRHERIASRDKADRIDVTLPADRIESTDRNEPIDKIDAAEPIDRSDPEEPIDRIDPFDPMLRIDPDEPTLRIDPDEPMDRPALPVCSMGPLWHPHDRTRERRWTRPSRENGLTQSEPK